MKYYGEPADSVKNTDRTQSYQPFTQSYQQAGIPCPDILFAKLTGFGGYYTKIFHFMENISAFGGKVINRLHKVIHSLCKTCGAVHSAENQKIIILLGF